MILKGNLKKITIKEISKKQALKSKGSNLAGQNSPLVKTPPLKKFQISKLSYKVVIQIKNIWKCFKGEQK